LKSYFYQLVPFKPKPQNQPSNWKAWLPVAHVFGGSGQNGDLFEIVALTTDTIAKHLPSNWKVVFIVTPILFLELQLRLH